MEIGIIGTQTIKVAEEQTAKHLGSGELAVFATPCMIALMENTAYKSVQPFLETAQGTVGTLLNVKHVAATPVGMEVRCETKLIEIDRKRLVFEVKAFDACGLIGEGLHERFIVDNQRFMQKTTAKLDKE